LLGWLDTPDDNFPQVFSQYAWGTFITMLDDIPLIGKQITKLVWNRAMNQRLGTQKLTWPQIVKEATNRGLSIGELMAIPEKEEWM